MADEIAGALFGAQVDRRRRAFLATADFAQPDRLAEMAGALADREHDIAGALEADADGLRQIVDHADAADRGGGQDRAAAAGRLALVIEADVARDDRIVKRAARLAHAVEAPGDLPHDLGALRIGEVEAVGDRERGRADRADVAPGFGDRLLAALDRVGIAIARGAVGAHRERAACAVDADERCVAADLHRVAADLAVILFVDPAAACDVGRSHERLEVGRDIGGFGDVGQVGLLRRRNVRPVIERRIVGERGERDIADDLAMMFQHHAPRIGDGADNREVEFPFLEDCLRKLFLAGLQDHQHAFLALGQHHLIGRHAGFALRHVVHLEVEADAAFRRHFDRRGGEARGAHVLDRDDRVRRHQLEACLDQQLFRKGIADLHRRALLLGILAEVGRRHRRAVDAVAAGFRSDIDDRIADAAGGRIEDLVLFGDADGHRVDQDVAVIGLVEIDLAAYGRNADAIAVAADAVDDARNEVLHLRMVGAAETQRVEVRDRARAHREDVAQDAADAGRRALIGFDVRRVVVALHLEDGGELLAVRPFADVDDAGIFAGAADHPRRLGGQFLQMDARAFVAAMLGPHDREDAEFDKVRFAPQRGEDALIFFRRQAMVGDDLGGDDGGGRACCLSHGAPLAM